MLFINTKVIKYEFNYIIQPKKDRVCTTSESNYL